MSTRITYTVSQLVPLIDWVYFYHAWQVKADSSEGQRLHGEALRLLETMKDEVGAIALIRTVQARSDEDDIRITLEPQELRIPLLRRQKPDAAGNTLCLSDFVNPRGDTIGLFATTCPLSTQSDDPYEALLLQTLATRLAEAAAEKVDNDTLTPGTPRGIRPAAGYPSLPDLSVNFILDQLLDMSSAGITLTPNGAMSPQASVSGLILRHPQARYFSVGPISREQFDDYVRRRNLPPDRMETFLRAVLQDEPQRNEK